MKEIVFNSSENNKDVFFIEKNEDMTCTIKVKDQTFEGRITHISSMGKYTILIDENKKGL